MPLRFLRVLAIPFILLLGLSAFQAHHASAKPALEGDLFITCSLSQAENNDTTHHTITLWFEACSPTSPTTFTQATYAQMPVTVEYIDDGPCLYPTVSLIHSTVNPVTRTATDSMWMVTFTERHWARGQHCFVVTIGGICYHYIFNSVQAW